MDLVIDIGNNNSFLHTSCRPLSMLQNGKTVVRSVLTERYNLPLAFVGSRTGLTFVYCKLCLLEYFNVGICFSI